MTVGVHVARHVDSQGFYAARYPKYDDTMYYVYVIESESSGSWYIGYTTDAHARLEKHNQNGNISTSKRGPWKLIYYEAYLDKGDALGREKFLKSGSGWKFLKKQVRKYLESK